MQRMGSALLGQDDVRGIWHLLAWRDLRNRPRGAAEGTGRESGRTHDGLDVSGPYYRPQGRLETDGKSSPPGEGCTMELHETEAVTLAKALSVKNRLAGRLSQARSNIET
jgi:hypothetical protein